MGDLIILVGHHVSAHGPGVSHKPPLLYFVKVRYKDVIDYCVGEVVGKY